MSIARQCRKILILCCVLYLFSPAFAAEAPEAFSSDAPLEFILRPVQAGFSASPRSTGRSTEVSFKKEPTYEGSKVHRSALWFGERPSDYIGMAYDRGANLLYIDRNRNLDLTDDGPGVAGDMAFFGFGNFSNVPIDLTHGDVPVRYMLEIFFYGGYVSATVQSGWEGDIEIAGKRCRMGIADNLDGVFDQRDSFRLDHAGHREARLPFGEVDELSLPRWLNFEGQSYRLESALRAEDGETALAVALHPITDTLMDVTFEGRFVSRAMLKSSSNEYLLLDWPSPAMRIPKGDYYLYRVDLLDSFSGYPRDATALYAGGNTTLKTGGPVSHAVSVKRAGGYLSLDYALTGIDKTRYSTDTEYRNPAQFAVYRGDRKVGGAKFEYG